MRGVILAAGRGSRLGDLTLERPKALVELRGAPLLAYQIAALREAGIGEIAVVTGYRAEAIGGDGFVRFHNARWADTNMVRSLQCASDWLKGSACVVSYADIVYSGAAVSRLLAPTADLAITYDPGWKSLWEQRFGSASTDAETFRRNPATGCLLEIGRPVTDPAAVEGQYMGLLRITPLAWGWIEELIREVSSAEADRLDVTRLLSELLDRGRAVATIPIADGWMEVDSESDLRLCLRLLDSGGLDLPAPASDVSVVPYRRML